MKQNELISKKHKKVCRILNYFEHLLILASTDTGFVSISALASLVGISVGIASSAVTIKISLIIVGIKKYKPIIKKKETKHKIVLLAKTNLNIIELLIFKALIDSSITRDEFASVNNVLKEYNMKEEIKNSHNK